VRSLERERESESKRERARARARARERERERESERAREGGREGGREREVSFLHGLSLNPKSLSRTSTHSIKNAKMTVSLPRATLRSEQLLCHPFLKRAAAKDALAALVAKHKGFEALSAESRGATSTSSLAATPGAAAQSGIVGAAGPAGDVRVSSAYERARPNEEHV
jgi:hypothetical protein